MHGADRAADLVGDRADGLTIVTQFADTRITLGGVDATTRSHLAVEAQAPFDGDAFNCTTTKQLNRISTPEFPPSVVGAVIVRAGPAGVAKTIGWRRPLLSCAVIITVVAHSSRSVVPHP